ncbi:MAG: signal peptidase I [Alteromonadaceae bacterium]|nr:signal peptidase I [Alteromonadaceae bacterium]
MKNDNRKRIATIIVSVLSAIGIVALTLWAVFDVFIIQSESMEPTLVSGDIVLCAKYLNIERGDIVFFTHPKYSNVGVKRVVGTPDDEIAYVNKKLMINGVLSKKEAFGDLPSNNPNDLLFLEGIFDTEFYIYESYFNTNPDIRLKTGDDYFLMGDNRDNSVDSRHLGLIPSKSIICKGWLILGSENAEKITLKRVGKI